MLRFRYELHPRVRGPRSIRRVLPLPLANGQQPIPRRAPHPEPRGYVLLGPHLLRALQKEDFLENLTLIPGDVVYITIAGVGIRKYLESGKQDADLLTVSGSLLSVLFFFFMFFQCLQFLVTTL